MLGRVFRRPHPDREIAKLLRRWKMPYGSPEAQACREMFAGISEMHAFFNLAFPSSVENEQSWYLSSTGLGLTPHARRTVALLAVLGARQEHRSGLAFFSWLQGRVASEEENSAEFLISYLGGLTNARRYTEAFSGLEYRRLRLCLRFVDWGNGRGIALWAIECDRLGVPDDYLQALMEGPCNNGRAARPWTPQQIAALYAAGMPVEYLIHFWDRPRALAEMWGEGVPFEYALALDGSPDAG